MHVLTSNNVVVALTINEDLEGVGLRTGSSLRPEVVAAGATASASGLSRVASVTIETEEGETTTCAKKTNVEINISPDLLNSLDLSSDSGSSSSTSP